MSMKKYHARRHRRTAKQTLKHGDSAKRKHIRKGGRTGSVRQKQIAAGIPLRDYMTGDEKAITVIERAIGKTGVLLKGVLDAFDNLHPLLTRETVSLLHTCHAAVLAIEEFDRNTKARQA